MPIRAWITRSGENFSFICGACTRGTDIGIRGFGTTGEKLTLQEENEPEARSELCCTVKRWRKIPCPPLFHGLLRHDDPTPLM